MWLVGSGAKSSCTTATVLFQAVEAAKDFGRFAPFCTELAKIKHAKTIASGNQIRDLRNFKQHAAEGFFK